MGSYSRSRSRSCSYSSSSRSRSRGSSYCSFSNKRQRSRSRGRSRSGTPDIPIRRGLHHFWKKGESQVQENDPFHTDARGSVMTAPLPRVLTVHTPDLVDLIQDPHAQGPVLVHSNGSLGYHGQEAGVDHQFIHHEKRF